MNESTENIITMGHRLLFIADVQTKDPGMVPCTKDEDSSVVTSCVMGSAVAESTPSAANEAGPVDTCREHATLSAFHKHKVLFEFLVQNLVLKHGDLV